MTNEQYERVCRLFEAFLPLTHVERQKRLDQISNDEPELHFELEQMLIVADKADGLTELPLQKLNPRGSNVQEKALHDFAGKRIGPYLIQRRIGMGGMGTIYEANRVDDFRQQVAIKLIRSGLNSDEFINRFRIERQVLATLQHPNIARLLDGGTTEDGQQYLVMEFIDGLPFDRYCDTHQLPLLERVKLLQVVAGAIQFAHENQVLHRDIKPGNILVTTREQPIVVDFGLAKLLRGDGEPHSTNSLHDDATVTSSMLQSLTQTGAIMGTPSYMAPEQIGSETRVGPAVDVYGIGAVLYQTLTGKPPFHAESPLETLIQVLGEDPVPPTHLNTKLPRDLEAICMMCLQKEPQHRYTTAGALSDDIGRYLAHDPIKAKPISLWTRTQKFIRRNRMLVGSAALVVLSLALGLIVASIGLFRAQTAEVKLQSELITAQDRAATLAMQQGNWESALSSYDAALTLGHPDPIGTRLKRVRVLQALNVRDQVNEEIQTLGQLPELKAKPHHEATWLLIRADLSLGTFGETTQALEDLGRAIVLGLSPADNEYARGLRTASAPESLEFMVAALNHDKFHHQAQMMKVMLNTILGHIDESKLLAESLAMASPSDHAPQVCLAWIDLMTGHHDKAQSRIEGARHSLGDEHFSVLKQLFQVIYSIQESFNKGDAIAIDHTSYAQAFRMLKQMKNYIGPNVNLEPLGLKAINLPCVKTNWALFEQSIKLANENKLQAAINVLKPAVVNYPDGLFHFWQAHLLMELSEEQLSNEKTKTAVPKTVEAAEASFRKCLEHTSFIPRLGRDARFWGAYTQTLLVRRDGSHRSAEMRPYALQNLFWLLSNDKFLSVAECGTIAGEAMKRLKHPGIVLSLLIEGLRLAPDDPGIQLALVKFDYNYGAFIPALEGITKFCQKHPQHDEGIQFKKKIIEKLNEQSQIKQQP